MKRKTFAWLLVAGLMGAAAWAQTADEIIEKNIQARGGREKLKAVESVRMSGKMSMGQGMEAPFTLEMARPKKVRLEFTIQGMTGVQVYDGTTGWAVMPFMGKTDPEEVAGDDLKEMEDQADIDGALVDYKEKGHQVELLGKEDLEGTPAYKLKLTKKNGDVNTIYIDAESYLEMKIEGKRKVRGQDVEVESTPGDYKPVAGVMFPHTLENKAKGAPAGQTITIEKIEVNPTLGADEFAKPKPAAAPPKKQ
jgi:outer membrane lipoprotein-sorting protein